MAYLYSSKVIVSEKSRTKPLRDAELSDMCSLLKLTMKSIKYNFRWLQLTSEQSAIESSIFGAHFTRGASASAATKGGITKENIKAANLGGWSLNFTTMGQPIVGLLLTRIAWSKLQTTQCMCETEPSEIISK